MARGQYELMGQEWLIFKPLPPNKPGGAPSPFARQRRLETSSQHPNRSNRMRRFGFT